MYLSQLYISVIFALREYFVVENTSYYTYTNTIGIRKMIQRQRHRRIKEKKTTGLYHSCLS